MPRYDFQDEDGNVFEFTLSINETVPIGRKKKIDGKTYTRVFDMGALPEISVEQNIYFTSNALPRSEWIKERAPRVDSMGRPVFVSKSEVREFEAKTGYKHNEL